MSIDLPSSTPAAAYYLDFSRDVLTSTTLSLRGNDGPVYEMSSENGLSTTYMRRGGALAKIARGALILPDKITLRGRVPMKVSAWLKPEDMLATIPVTMTEGIRGGRTTLSYFLSWGPAMHIWIAWYQPTARRLFDGKSVLMLVYLALQDAVVISCLVLAKTCAGRRKGTTIQQARRQQAYSIFQL
ncbi:hypothetical protein DFH09DRAFT_1471221 [Mycena vulgaris]|nr:hypothetical protein DFH09DRAFT_1471221 [Mycena vulgaris]